MKTRRWSLGLNWKQGGWQGSVEILPVMDKSQASIKIVTTAR